MTDPTITLKQRDVINKQLAQPAQLDTHGFGLSGTHGFAQRPEWRNELLLNQYFVGLAWRRAAPHPIRIRSCHARGQKQDGEGCHRAG